MGFARFFLWLPSMGLLSTSNDSVWLLVGDTAGPLNSTSNQNANPCSGAGNQRKLESNKKKPPRVARNIYLKY